MLLWMKPERSLEEGYELGYTGEVLEAINSLHQQQKFKLNPKILIIIAVIIGLICGIFAIIKVTQEPGYEEVQPGKDFLLNL